MLLQMDIENNYHPDIKISKLTNIELSNNTRNLSKSQNVSNVYHKQSSSQMAAKEFTLNSLQQHLKALEIPENHDGNTDHCHLLTTTTGPTESSAKPVTAAQINDEKCCAPMTTTTVNDRELEDEKLTEELEQHLLQGKQKQHQQQQSNAENNINEIIRNANDRLHKDSEGDRHQFQHHNSDSDSALSSAPPSISPQPSTNDGIVEPTDIWQTVRTYTQDVEKLQKEIQILERQNSDIRAELQMAKDQIIDYEKSTTSCELTSTQFFQRIKYLEEQEHRLQDECNDLREQNELLEFRILELEESNDKTNAISNTNHNNILNNWKNIWSSNSSGSTRNNNGSCIEDPFKMLFGSTGKNRIRESDILMDPANNRDTTLTAFTTNEEILGHLQNLIEKSTLDSAEKKCLQRVKLLIQQFMDCGFMGYSSLPSDDNNNNFDMVKAANADCSFVLTANACASSAKLNGSNSGRIVATVSPYNSSPTNQSSLSKSAICLTQLGPSESPRKGTQQIWQNSLSESGVFVEGDFLGDASEQHVYTQTDFEEPSHLSPIHLIKPTQSNCSVHSHRQQHNPLFDQKRLDYYKDRLELLERKVSIYESSGDLQAKRLADRLQREIRLENEVKDLRDRVNTLVTANATLEEEKCEFEEAENDTRLRLQRLEIELEILSQRNVELEVSKEALSAKYKDCHSECLNLRDDLATSEIQIRHLEEDKQKAKENFDFLHRLLPLFLICNTLRILNYYNLSDLNSITYKSPLVPDEVKSDLMGNEMSADNGNVNSLRRTSGGADADGDAAAPCENDPCYDKCVAYQLEIQHLKEEINRLCYQIKELNSRYCATMESADSQWVELEREYKLREDQFRAKEACLKQKIQKLQDCLTDDARIANEKICQLEEAEENLKTCLVRVTKELRDLQNDHTNVLAESERLKEQVEGVKSLQDAIEQEKKRSKALTDEINFLHKLQQEMESHNKAELEAAHNQIYEIKKNFLHIEVTNGELKEEVTLLEQQVQTLQNQARENEDKIRTLADEIRTKDEMCQKLEKRLQRSEGTSLADELKDSPLKGLKRDDARDLKSATQGLIRALNIAKGSAPESSLEVRKIMMVAQDVSKLARSLLHEDINEDKDDDKLTEIDSKKGTNMNDSPDQKNQGESAGEEKTEEKGEEQGNDEEKKVEEGDPGSTANAVQQEEEEAQGVEVEMNSEREEGGEQPPEELIKTDPFIGMTLMPEINLKEKSLPTCLHDIKQVICEVPSRLRKLCTTSDEMTSSMRVSLGVRVIRKKCRRRYLRRRLLMRTLRKTRVKRITNFEDCSGSNVSFNDVADEDSIKSNIVKDSDSHTSFLSIQDEFNDAPNRTDACTETEIKAEKKEESVVEKATEVEIPKEDRSIQVNDELEIGLQMNLMPAPICCFLNMLKASATSTQYTMNVINWKLNNYWQTDSNFQRGLEILVAFSAFKSDDVVPIVLQNYDEFVAAMASLHILCALFKPSKVPILNQIEEQLNEQLMTFHNRKMESEFYCTVYYPVKRPD